MIKTANQKSDSIIHSNATAIQQNINKSFTHIHKLRKNILTCYLNLQFCNSNRQVAIIFYKCKYFNPIEYITSKLLYDKDALFKK